MQADTSMHWVVSGLVVCRSCQLSQEDRHPLENHDHQDNVKKALRKKTRKERGTKIYHMNSSMK